MLNALPSTMPFPMPFQVDHIEGFGVGLAESRIGRDRRDNTSQATCTVRQRSYHSSAHSGCRYKTGELLGGKRRFLLFRFEAAWSVVHPADRSILSSNTGRVGLIQLGK